MDVQPAAWDLARLRAFKEQYGDQLVSQYPEIRPAALLIDRGVNPLSMVPAQQRARAIAALEHFERRQQRKQKQQAKAAAGLGSVLGRMAKHTKGISAPAPVKWKPTPAAKMPVDLQKSVSFNAVDHKGIQYPAALAETLNRPTWKGTTSLGDQIGGWYHRIPGGLNKAIDSSQVMQKKVDAHPGLKNYREEFPSFSPNQIRRPTEVWAQQADDLGNMDGFILPGSQGQPIWARATPDQPDLVGPTTLQHELSHRAFGMSPSSLQRTSSAVDVADDPSALKQYLTAPHEMDARLAEIKRRYASDVGRLVDSPSEADEALRWWQDEGVWLDKARPEAMRASNPFAFSKEISDADEATMATMRLRMAELLGLGGVAAGTGVTAGTVKGAWVEKLAAEATGLTKLPPKPKPVAAPPKPTLKPLPPSQVPSIVGGTMNRASMGGRESTSKPLQQADSQWWNPFQSGAEARRGESLAQRQQAIQRPSFHAQTDLASNVGRWYENAGGYPAAEAAAMQAQHNNTMRPPTGDWRKTWPSFSAKSLHKPVDVYVQGQEGVPASNGVSVNGADTIWLDAPGVSAVNKAAPTQLPQNTLEHELSHASYGVNSLEPFPLPQETKSNPPIGYSDKYVDYTLIPAEIDVRLAEIKRRFAHETGTLVETPQQAEQAWDWWFNGQDGGPSGAALEKQRTPHDRATLLHGGNEFYKDIPKEQIRQWFHRMPELVQNNYGAQPKMGSVNSVNKNAAAAALQNFLKLAQTGYSPIPAPKIPKPAVAPKTPPAPVAPTAPRPAYSPIAPPNSGALKTVPAPPKPTTFTPQVPSTGGMFGWGQQKSHEAAGLKSPGTGPITGYEADGDGLKRNDEYGMSGSTYAPQIHDRHNGTSYGPAMPIWSTSSNPANAGPNWQRYLEETDRYSTGDALSTQVKFNPYLNKVPGLQGAAWAAGTNSDLMKPLSNEGMERFSGKREPGVTERLLQDWLPKEWNDSMGVGDWATSAGESYDWAMDRSGARDYMGQSAAGNMALLGTDAVRAMYGEILPNPVNPSRQFVRHGAGAIQAIDAMTSDWPIRAGQQAVRGVNAAKGYANRVAPTAMKYTDDVARRAMQAVPQGVKTVGNFAGRVGRPVASFFKPSALPGAKLIANKVGPWATAAGLGWDALRFGGDIGANASIVPIANYQNPELNENWSWTPGEGNAAAVEAAGAKRQGAYNHMMRMSENMGRDAVRNYVPGAGYALGMDPETRQTNVEWLMGSVSPMTPGARQAKLRQAYTDGITSSNGHSMGGYINQADKQLQESIFHNVLDGANQLGGAAGYWAGYPVGAQDYFDADSLMDSPIIPTGFTPGMRRTPYQMWYGEGSYMHPDAQISDATSALQQERMQQDQMAALAAQAASQGQ